MLPNTSHESILAHLAFLASLACVWLFLPVWPLWPVLWPFGLYVGLFGLAHKIKREATVHLYICSSSNLNMPKRVCRDCPVPECGAKYLVRLANHLTGVHKLDSGQRKMYLQEAKLQPKVRYIVYKTACAYKNTSP